MFSWETEHEQIGGVKCGTDELYYTKRIKKNLMETETKKKQDKIQLFSVLDY